MLSIKPGRAHYHMFGAGRAHARLSLGLRPSIDAYGRHLVVFRPWRRARAVEDVVRRDVQDPGAEFPREAGQILGPLGIEFGAEIGIVLSPVHRRIGRAIDYPLDLLASGKAREGHGIENIDFPVRAYKLEPRCRQSPRELGTQHALVADQPDHDGIP